MEQPYELSVSFGPASFDKQQVTTNTAQPNETQPVEKGGDYVPCFAPTQRETCCGSA
ncbi:TPA: hypothetical protein NJT28_000721 [Corynebacterium striatum]|uniref:hypothetical protein n=1 Tax=Corynebacterium striatum TaxID=43770 RepID=UPI0012FCBC92|nr:hypothetical protein [Corynebacterium striatum]HCG2962087.1 hypothetical protein [Corynebacterium striatum]